MTTLRPRRRVPGLSWIQPVARVSHVDDVYAAPRELPGLSAAWDWTKVDLGVRVGIVADVDLTAGYARNDARTATGTLHADEVLVTLRAGF
jgi:hypothetical protein